MQSGFADNADGEEAVGCNHSSMNVDGLRHQKRYFDGFVSLAVTRPVQNIFISQKI
jgi:hypothetical protein